MTAVPPVSLQSLAPRQLVCAFLMHNMAVRCTVKIQRTKQNGKSITRPTKIQQAKKQ